MKPIEETSAYHGLGESLETLRDEIRRVGGVDGLLGFSQGAVLIHAAMHDEEIRRQIQFAILIGGFPAKPLSGQRICPHIRTLHVFGRQDSRVPARCSMMLAARCADCSLFMHAGGHAVPSSKAFRSMLQDFVLQPTLQQPQTRGLHVLPFDLKFHFLCAAFMLKLGMWARRLATLRCARTPSSST